MKLTEKTETKQITRRLSAPIVLTPDQIASIAGGFMRTTIPHSTNTDTATSGMAPRKLIKL